MWSQGCHQAVLCTPFTTQTDHPVSTVSNTQHREIVKSLRLRSDGRDERGQHRCAGAVLVSFRCFVPDRRRLLQAYERSPYPPTVGAAAAAAAAAAAGGGGGVGVGGGGGGVGGGVGGGGGAAAAAADALLCCMPACFAMCSTHSTNFSMQSTTMHP